MVTCDIVRVDKTWDERSNSSVVSPSQTCIECAWHSLHPLPLPLPSPCKRLHVHSSEENRQHAPISASWSFSPAASCSSCDIRCAKSLEVSVESMGFFALPPFLPEAWATGGAGGGLGSWVRWVPLGESASSWWAVVEPFGRVAEVAEDILRERQS